VPITVWVHINHAPAVLAALGVYCILVYMAVL